MKQHAKTTSVVLAIILQFLPVARQVAMQIADYSPNMAVFFRWGIGLSALLGGVDAVSGASTVITSPKTATATNGVAFTYRITTGPEVANTFNAAPLPPNLVVGTSTGKITGTPATNGVFSITLTASDNNQPSRTVTAVLTLTIIPGVSVTAPSITTQPISQTVTAGGNVSFSVVATGTAPLAYQWKFNGANISGATSATLTLNNVQVANAGTYSVVINNSAGSATSANATLTVNPAPVAPAITTQPSSQTVTAGANVTFTVVSSGTAPLTYQWKFNGANISGATSATFTFNNAQSANAGMYSVVVNNSAGSATSANATLTVNPAPVAPAITTQPSSQTVTAGANVTFTVVASGTAPLSYQWKFNGANISGTTSATLTLNSVQAANAGAYTVVVSNSAGSVTSGNASLTVNPAIVAPTITTQPLSQSVVAGGSVSFSVVASGTAPLTYQWRFNGANIPGATSASLNLSNVQTADAGNYSVVVINAAGSITSANATLTVTVAIVPPTITSQPVSQTVTAGATVTFTVAVNGSAPLSYQWRFNGSNISGATRATLTLNSVQSANAGSYSVVVNNSAGSATSANATLNVNPAPVPPAITTQPSSQTVTAGTNVTFTVAASGTAPLTYQWKLNGSNIGGATSATLTLNNVQAANAGSYSVAVSNSAGSATSANATLTVNPAPVAPTITTQPLSQSIVAGGSVSFSVAASGTAPLAYQWRFNGANIPGATSATLSLNNVQTTQAGTYSVVVSNSAGTVTSAGASLAVQPATAVLTVAVNGNGTVAPDLNGQNLVIGSSYSLTAVPDAGNSFTGWSGSLTSTNPTLDFVMQAGLNLQATFAASPTNTVTGSFAGLFYPATGAQYENAGMITLKVTSGQAKGGLCIGATRYKFGSHLDATGHGFGTATCAAQLPLALDLQSDSAAINGTVSDSHWIAAVQTDKAGNVPCPHAGTYQIPLPDQNNTPSKSVVTAVVDAKGKVTLKGTLATGERVRLKTSVSQDGVWPLYVRVRDGEAMIGWIKLQDPVAGTVAGDVQWLTRGATAGF